MPETIRTANERLRSRPWRGGFLAALVTVNLCLVPSAPAHAEAGLADVFGRQGVAALTLMLGLICFSALATILLLRTRKSAERIANAARDEAMTLHAEIDRLRALLLAEPQVL